MEQEIKVCSLQQHLDRGRIPFYEDALNLKATIGFPYAEFDDIVHRYEFQYFDLEKFVKYGRRAATVSGEYYNKEREMHFDITIILYDDRYYVQVGDDSQFGISNVYNSFRNYYSALVYAYEKVMKGE